MPFDLVIRGGRVVDGTGRAETTADVAVIAGVIVEVGRVDGPADREIDADGALVIPGFVDIHTHYDGQATWDEGFKTLNDAFTKLNDNLAKANIKPTGNPMAVFTETDDAGFKFTAMVPVEKAPEAKPADLAADVGFGDSPGGKVMKFQHRSAYDDIDSTYEAITAYLDEKGLEAKNMFAEEYLNRTKASDDNSLEVDIYVFLK